MNVKTYLEDRVDDQLNYHSGRASYFKKAHNRLQVMIIVLGVIVPVVINLPFAEFMDMQPNADDHSIRMGVTGLSLVLAVLSALANFKQYGEKWVIHRTTEEKLKKEKFMYLTGSGKYKAIDASTAFLKFVEHVERILSTEVSAFEEMMTDQLQQPEVAPAANEAAVASTSPPTPVAATIPTAAESEPEPTPEDPEETGAESEEPLG